MKGAVPLRQLSGSRHRADGCASSKIVKHASNSLKGGLSNRADVRDQLACGHAQ